MQKETDGGGIEIRPLRLREAATILKFRAKNDYQSDKDSVKEDLSSESFLYVLLKMIWHRRQMTTLVAIREGRIVGYITVIFGRNRWFRGNSYIVSAAVDRSERGRGIGSALFGKVEDIAKTRGTRRIEFEVFSSNERAIKLYERLGYEVEGVKRRAVQGPTGYDDLILMAKFVDSQDVE